MHAMLVKAGWTRPGFLLGLVLCVATLDVGAEASKFTPQEVKVVPAAIAFGPIRTRLAMGSPLVVPVGASPRARDLFDKGFQVRIFRVAGAQQLPRHIEFFDPCYIYLSSIVHFDGSKAVEATVSYLNDLGWLDISNGRSAEPGHFLLVVEAKGGSGSLFRLDGRKNQREQYFRSGVYFEVHAGRQVTPAEMAREAAASNVFMQKVMDLARVNSRDVRCFNLQARYARDEDELLAYAQPPCTDPLEFAADQ